MKRLLLLLIASLACTYTAHAIEPLDGAFGLKFGDVFTSGDNNPQGNVRTDEHAKLPAFRFQPAKPNRLFSEYWVYMTPISHRIYRIVAVGHANNEELALSQQNAVLTVARQRYDGDFSIHDRWINQGCCSITVRPPSVQADGSALWQVAYTDQALAGRILTANNGAFDEADETGL